MSILNGLVKRILPNLKESIKFVENKTILNGYNVSWDNGLIVEGDTPVNMANGLYDYLRKYCRINLSWCGNQNISLDKLVSFDGQLTKHIHQQYRVYMNYCTLAYSMSWWNFERWEKELDYMALNGINMPLCAIGSEAVWFETMKEIGLSESEALASISGIAFYPWHLMTNIDSYYPPNDVKYVYERLELGKKIIDRALEYGMHPILQGFSGHVPVSVMKKHPNASFSIKNAWCNFPKTAQLDPLDPLFGKIGKIWLDKQNRLLGNYHFLACDPFHENAPPKKGLRYLARVGKAIDEMYKSFDPESVWVMQSWSMRKTIAKAVPKDRLLILDINSCKSKTFAMPKNYNVVAGQLHDFGGKNAMQGKLVLGSKNPYHTLKKSRANLVGSGMFMEGIEQNPVIYEMQFDLLTLDKPLDFNKWLDDYIDRRYSNPDNQTFKKLRGVWDTLIETCYKDSGYSENGVGTAIAARPSLENALGSPCDSIKNFYDRKKFETCVKSMLSLAETLKNSDGYQFDLYDMTRQALSNLFDDKIKELVDIVKSANIELFKEKSSICIELLRDLDDFLSLRSDYSLSRWINDAHTLASDENERKYFDEMARCLITLWGDVNTDASLTDYAWREWSGLIKEYYLPRWQKYFDYISDSLEKGKIPSTNRKTGLIANNWRTTPFYDKLADFELNFVKTYKDYPLIKNADVTEKAKALIDKYCM